MKRTTWIVPVGALLLNGCNIPTSWEALTGWSSWWFIEASVETIGEFLLPWIRVCLAPMALAIGMLALVQSLRVRKPFWDMRGWQVAILAFLGAVFVIGYAVFLTEIGKETYPDGLLIDRVGNALNWNLSLLDPLDFLIDGLAVIFTVLLPLVHKAMQGLIVFATLIIIYASLGARSPSGFILALTLPAGWFLWPHAFYAEIALAETNLPKVVTDFDAIRFFTNFLYILGTTGFWLLINLGIPILSFGMARMVIPERETETEGPSGPEAPEGASGDDAEELPEARGGGRGTQYVPIPVVIRVDGQSANPEEEDDAIVTPAPQRKRLTTGEDGNPPPPSVDSTPPGEPGGEGDDDDDELPPASPDSGRRRHREGEFEEDGASEDVESSELSEETADEELLPERRTSSQESESEGLPDARRSGRRRRNVPPERRAARTATPEEELPEGRVKPRSVSAPPASSEPLSGSSSRTIDESPEEPDELPSVRQQPTRSAPPPPSPEPEEERPARDLRTEEDIENDADTLPPARGRGR